MATRLRTKRRGLHQRGRKLDGTTLSLDMCPCCISFGCDPTAMSPAFRHKVDERMRKGLCPACGNPAPYCRCKSSEDPGKIRITRAHNNRKLEKAIRDVEKIEAAYAAWRRNCDALIGAMGEELYDRVYRELQYHRVPDAAFETISGHAEACGIDLSVLSAGWDEPIHIKKKGV